jgi:dTDP-4-amino-4,6-dideoxygalactose transaminase
MKIEVFSPTIRRKEMDAVLTAMVEDRIGPGDYSRLLVQTAKEHLHFDFALALRSPATALRLALTALGLEDGDGVLVSALSPRYYASVLAELRLTPLYCDVSFSFPCISRESVEKAVAAAPDGVKARCIVLHHTLGFVPDIASLADFGLPVIEDVSQSFSPVGTLSAEQKEPDGSKESNGTKEPDSSTKTDNGPENAKAAEEAGKRICGIYTILGLEERDVLTSGGGALLYSSSRKDSAALRTLANIPPEYCLPDINAALAAAQFKETVRNGDRRREIAKAYTQASLRTRHKRFVPLDGTEYNNYAFPLILETGVKDVAAYARKKEIIIENAFEQSLAGAGISDSVLCPVSYSLSLRTILFPLYPRLRSSDAERVSKLIMTLP